MRVNQNTITRRSNFFKLLQFSNGLAKVSSIKSLGFANICQCSAVPWWMDARFYVSFTTLLGSDQR